MPWVKSPQDVIRLIDMYLVQTTAKRILRYHYHTDPMDIANLATVVGDRRVTDPWMEWLFSRTFIYPLPVGGIQDTMISGTNREGTEFVGTTYYAQGEGASRVAASLDRYLRAGGNPAYDLSDQRRYPKPVAHVYWRLENVVGGRDFLRIGDVCGPDKGPGHTLRDLGFARSGWRWTQDPKFAFILQHALGREQETDAEWAEIEAAAAKQSARPVAGQPLARAAHLGRHPGIGPRARRPPFPPRRLRPRRLRHRPRASRCARPASRRPRAADDDRRRPAARLHNSDRLGQLRPQHGAGRRRRGLPALVGQRLGRPGRCSLPGGGGRAAQRRPTAAAASGACSTWTKVRARSR